MFFWEKKEIAMNYGSTSVPKMMFQNQSQRPIKEFCRYSAKLECKSYTRFRHISIHYCSRVLKICATSEHTNLIHLGSELHEEARFHPTAADFLSPAVIIVSGQLQEIQLAHFYAPIK